MSPSSKSKPVRKNAAAARSGRKSGARPPRLSPDLEWEIRLGHPRVALIGIDEVGRGCLAGPVVAAAVLIPPGADLEAQAWLKEITDSKCLSPEKREALAPRIESWALSFGIGSASVEEIDRINIYHASHLAMIRAVEATLELARSRATLPAALHALVDGNVVPKGLPCGATAVVKGDLRCLSVAAASILAKVWRDRLMAELDAKYPGYGFAVHKGYSTPSHVAALRAQGPCELHRRSFAPIAQMVGRPGGDPAQLELC